jgi:hypothetical protein
VILDNATVVITGASAGIGRALARRIAPTARRLILVARRLDRLEELARELTAQHPRLDVRCERADLADAADLDRLCATLDALGPIDVLVNNAGVGDFGVFDRAPWPRVDNMVRLNVVALTRLTHHVLPGMVARGRGGVLNMSSGFGIAFTPGFAAYIGTKHYVSGFTEGLNLDLAGTGVVATHVCPGPVATEFATATGAPAGFPTLEELMPRWLMTTDDVVADAAVRGLEAGRPMVVPGVIMKVLWLLNGISPRPLTRLVMTPFARLLRRRELEAAQAPKQLEGGARDG